VTLRFSLALAHLLLGAFTWAVAAALATEPVWLAIAAALLVALLVDQMSEYMLERVVLRRPETWAMRLTLVAVAQYGLFSPLTAVLMALSGESVAERPLGSVSEDELKTWVEVGEHDGGLEQGEREMIYSIFGFGDTLCREIMVPRVNMLALDVNTPLPEALDVLISSGHSRVPVYDETVDNIVGMLYSKDLLKITLVPQETVSIRQFLRPAYYVPESKKVDDLLQEMQSNRTHIAVVVDEYGGVAGLVTLEDIMEEIVGEIRDEYDQSEEADVQQVGEGEYLFKGEADLDDFNEVTNLHLPKDLADTLGGYVYGRLGRVPVQNEKLDVEGWRLTVEQVSRRQIRKIRVNKIPSNQGVEEEKE
jgi:CBS domain containing-hemolysin-like protein